MTLLPATSSPWGTGRSHEHVEEVAARVRSQAGMREAGSRCGLQVRRERGLSNVSLGTRCDAVQVLTGAVPGERMSVRSLHVTWTDAGRRRIIARALRASGCTYAEIANLLRVSHEQARRDCADR